MRAFILLAALAAAVQAADKPNVIFLLVDDYGYNDVGFRNPEISTPNIDALVKSDGIIFTNGYTSQQCSPSRSSLMSGRYPYTSGMQHSVIHDESPQCMDTKFKFIPDYLKPLGYRTHMGGKWHLGYCNPACTPTFRGFDTFTGGYSGEGNYYNHTTVGGMYDWHIQEGDKMTHDTTPVGHHSQDLIQDDLIKVIETEDDAPFFYFASFHNTHAPLLPKEEFYDLYKDRMDITETRKKYLGLVSGVDAVVGNVLEALKAAGKWENTYLFLSSDNGGDVGEGDNTPRRGAKSSLFEGGCHAHSWAASPLLKKKGMVEADGLMHITDWLPTIVELAGGEVPASDGLDGIAQVELVTNAGASNRKNMIYNIDMEVDIGAPNFGCMAARDERYKLIWGFEGRSDGYGMDAGFIYDQERVVEKVKAADALIGMVDRKKRGGPYFLTTEQTHILTSYVTMTTISHDMVDAGTGPMMFFDLQEDPNETTDLAASDDPVHVAAKASLVKFLQDSVNSDRYYSIPPYTQIPSKKFDGVANGNVLIPGWCTDLYPPKE